MTITKVYRKMPTHSGGSFGAKSSGGSSKYSHRSGTGTHAGTSSYGAKKTYGGSSHGGFSHGASTSHSRLAVAAVSAVIVVVADAVLQIRELIHLVSSTKQSSQKL
jgi:hypothetical protein